MALDHSRVPGHGAASHEDVRSSILDVSGQKQQCNDGKWVHDPANGPQDPLDAKRKPCVDAFKQEYASGLLRETTDGFERCSDGKWVTKTP